MNSYHQGPSRERLLKAATVLFASHGYRGTSTQQIAALAGVNQVTVFRLFRSKRALFLKVLERSIARNTLDSLQKTLASSPKDAVVFRHLTSQLDKLFDPTLVRLLLFGGLEQPAQLQKLLRTRLHAFYRQVGDHLQQRVERGAFRALDPSSMCRALVAMLIYEQVFRDLFEGAKGNKVQRSTPHLLYLDIWLNGVLAKPAKSSPVVRPHAGSSKHSDAVGWLHPYAEIHR